VEKVRDLAGLSGSAAAVDDEMKGRYLTFLVDKQTFGVPITDVVQIVGVHEITKVPEFPEFAKGIINLRGNIIPLIDVRLRFHKEEIPYNERTCVIVTSIADRYIGLVVDSVDEVSTIGDEEISPPPRFSSDYTNNFITGVGLQNNEIILLLDTQKILGNAEIERLSVN
jgi:purine-binding chemotaxis protein CheW